MAENFHFYSLKEISEWQLNNSHSDVALPPLQRGFVWKVNQIESLWDSLLRGFPIGSFLLSRNGNGKLDLLDGQQRATSIALGFYDPWNEDEKKIGSIKKNPLVWIDLTPREITQTQKFVIRVITQSHPWGYQRKNNDRAYPLIASDKNKALTIFRKNSAQDIGYTQLPLTKVFPFDADLPVPLCFIFKAIKEGQGDWGKYLLSYCKDKLPSYLRTKYFENEELFFERLDKVDFHSANLISIYNSVSALSQINIPGIFVEENVLFEEDGETVDPTLFIRFNRGGTRIEGEELVYSIYKAAFPESKDLVENIQANYIAPSRVITLVSRLAQSEVDNGFSHPLNPVQFKKKIKEETFRNKLKEFIGNKNESPSEKIFSRAIELLRSENNFNLPSFVIKKMINDNTELFLMLLKWLRINNTKEIDKEEREKILAIITALSFFGSDNARYVREVWNGLDDENFWNLQKLKRKFKGQNDYIMFPLKPKTLRKFLLDQIVDKKKEWNNLIPHAESEVLEEYKKLFNEEVNEIEAIYSINAIWKFINSLNSCRPLVLIAQRDYINKNFGDFNQMETLEDSNAPWDWDHIYPDSWVYYQQTFQLIKEWNNCIGNFRVLSFEINRSENNTISPSSRLKNSMKDSFVKENDWEWWQKIDHRIYQADKVSFHSCAVINRMVNIYEEWYTALRIEELLISS